MPRKAKKKSEAQTESGSKPGRKSLYRPDFDDLGFDLAKAGATVKEIAKAFGVSTFAVEDWMRKHDAFARAIKKGRWQFDTKQIENALRSRALGFTYEEVTVEAIVLLDGDEEDTFVERKDTVGGNGKSRTRIRLVPGYKRKVTTKQVIPDVGALCFWLCNRQPEDWKNVQRQIVEGKVEHEHNHYLDLTKYSRKELEQLRSLISKGTPDDPDADSEGSGQRSGVRQPVPLRLSAVAGS